MRQPSMPGAFWYSGAGSINEPTPEPLTIDAYYEVLPEPPLLGTPAHPETAARWKAAVEKADEIVATIWKQEGAYNAVDMYAAVSEVIETGSDFKAEDVLAAYRKRREAKRNG